MNKRYGYLCKFLAYFFIATVTEMTPKKLQNPLKCEDNQTACFPRNVKAGRGAVVHLQPMSGAKLYSFI